MKSYFALTLQTNLIQFCNKDSFYNNFKKGKFSTKYFTLTYYRLAGTLKQDDSGGVYPGDACASDSECISDDCQNGTCKGLDFGYYCTSDDQCDVGLFCNSSSVCTN